MATYKFGPGWLIDYYNGLVNRTAWMGFPIADFNDFDSGIYASPAVAIPLLDLVECYWRVENWSVAFSQTSPVILGTRQFVTNLIDEFQILENFGQSWSDSATNAFAFGVVIDADGNYGLQSDLANNGDPDMVAGVYHLTGVSGTTLTFTDPSDSGNTAIATPESFWGWA